MQGLQMTAEQVKEYYLRHGWEMPPAVAAAVEKRGAKKRPAAKAVRYREREEPLRIELPFIYPSRNETEQLDRFVKASRKKAWVRDARLWVMVRERQAPGSVLGAYRSRVRIKAILHVPDPGRRRDLDNYSYKWLKDALTGYLFADDSARYVEDEVPEFAGLDGRPEPWMEIIVTPIGAIPERRPITRTCGSGTG